MLYPAVANIMVDGTTALSAVTTGPNSSTVASSKYGTVQSDGRMYYYTDIKGSKPIKDPRIGSHFGSQRHKWKSLQKLEQETATHGDNVYSIDGRLWARAYGDDCTITYNNNLSQAVSIGNGNHVEIVGYFNDMNIQVNVYDGRQVRYTLDGGTENTTDYPNSTVQNPIDTRYLDASNIINLGLSTTLGIHTIKLRNTNGSSTFYFSGIELIAQDTTSTATKSQIQIPSQNVVSYGKKFTVAETKHYNPFAFKTDGSTAWSSGAHNSTAWPIGTGSSTNIDTATSLGLAAWVSTNYYKPYNGGRVVKWVASDGTIKTSVNMMPPNARSIANSASLTNGTEKGDDSAGTSSAAVANSTFYPTFTDQAVDHSQAEVAKTFNWREFGNGSANGGTGSGTFADASMLKTGTSDNVAYVMDDGLTSLSAENIEGDGDELTFRFNGNTAFYITFIGTGISIEKKVSDTQAGSDSLTYTLDGVALTTYSSSNATHPKFINLAQNLPYGTHILKVSRAALSNIHPYWKEFTFHQPKMPPIPEDAVVIADYMLMADFVVQTAGTVGHISKGVRSISSSRDHFYDSSGVTFANNIETGVSNGFSVSTTALGSGNTATVRLPYFGTDFLMGHYGNRSGTITENLNSDVGTYASISTTTYSGLSKHTGNNLGVNEIKNHITDGQNDDHMWIGSSQIATPIHTSSHYKSFETPYLHELVGGDRNMEQTNLVVTPDGKTWDEVTRDVSYIGNLVLSGNNDAGYVSSGDTVVFDDWRGTTSGKSYSNKDSFAIAFDRVICLVDGEYEIYSQSLGVATKDGSNIVINGEAVLSSNTETTDAAHSSHWVGQLARGDYIKIMGTWYTNNKFSYFQIRKVNK
jgi:hypothetical protein